MSDDPTREPDSPSRPVPPPEDLPARLAAVERKLAEVQAHLAASQRIARVGSWELDLVEVTDVDVNPLRWTDECYRVFGFEPGEVRVTNEVFWSRVHPDDRPRIQEAVRKALDTGTVYSIDHRIVLPDGRERLIHERAEIVWDAAHKPLRMIGTAQDITERVSLEDQVRQAQKAEALGRLSGGMAHDFNNVLTVILGFADDLLHHLPEGDPLQENVDQILRAARRAAALTRQLLAFGRRQIIAPRTLQLDEVVADLGPMLRRLIEAPIDLRVVREPALGPVRLDRGQVDQVIINLVVNARDAMPSGGLLTIETANVELDAAYAERQLDVRPGPYVLLSVADTGHGMDEHVRTHLFEPFFTTKGGGTGLGLATVYGIVKQNQGHVSVESEPGVGTVFRVYFPRDAGPVETAPAEPPEPAAVGGSATVLLVEDEDAVRVLCVTALRRAGYTVLEAPHPVEALALLEQLAVPIDLLLTDVVMPHMNGRELADRLIVRQPGIRVLFMSGYSEDAMVLKRVVEEGLPFLAKPFTPAELMAKVREVLYRGPRS